MKPQRKHASGVSRTPQANFRTGHTTFTKRVLPTIVRWTEHLRSGYLDDPITFYGLNYRRRSTEGFIGKSEQWCNLFKDRGTLIPTRVLPAIGYDSIFTEYVQVSNVVTWENETLRLDAVSAHGLHSYFNLFLGMLS